jgi:hypothetical protein
MVRLFGLEACQLTSESICTYLLLEKSKIQQYYKTSYALPVCKYVQWRTDY